MSIRLRLALYCTLECVLILLVIGLSSYALHARELYDDLDTILVTVTEHAATETTTQIPSLTRTRGFAVALRLYTPDGIVRQSVPDTDPLPALDPQRIVAEPSGPAFDMLAALAPSPETLPAPSANNAFGLILQGQQRWRVYVKPLSFNGQINGYIAAFAPLNRQDSAVQNLRIMLLLFGVLGAIIALVSSRMLAGRTLRPIAHMTRTVQAIALSRDFSQRIETRQRHDELGCLAQTFNVMLESLEEAYRTQQRFVADASHELRAPLTAIQGNLELLRRQPDMNAADRAEAFTEAEREAVRMTHLVADLLILARADAGIQLKKRPVDVDAVLLDAFRTAHTLAHGQTLHLDPFEPLRVEGDTDRITQLVLILLDNALKYTPASGSVTLGLRRVETIAEISVRDTGVGISANAVAHVFERFYRADPARGRDPSGTGLGLSIAEWIVAQHNGTITLASEVGKGTTIIIRLPLLA